MKAVIIISLLLCCKGQAQKDTSNHYHITTSQSWIWETPFNKNENCQTLGFKLRVLPWLFAAHGGINVLAGIEQSFFKRHSIAIDGYYNGHQYSDENYSGEGNTNNYNLIEYYPKRAVFISYNYYFDFLKIREKKGVVFYLGLNCRQGDYKIMSNPILPEGPKVIVFKQEFKSIGPQIGTIFQFDDQVGMNINMTYYQSFNDNFKYSDSGTLLSNVFEKKNEFRLGVNFYFWLPYMYKRVNEE